MIWAFAALLVVWGNIVNYLIQPTLPGGSWPALAAGVSLGLVSLVVARLGHQTRAGAGLARGDLRGAPVGAALGFGAAIVGTIVLRIGPLLGGPVEYHPLFTTTNEELAAHIAFFLPLAVVLPEELAFRGVLLGGLWKTRGMRAGIVGSSIAFGLWHAFVVYATILQTNLADGVLPWLAGAGAVLFVAFAASVLALLRIRSGSLVAPILAHWAFDATMLLGLRA